MNFIQEYLEAVIKTAESLDQSHISYCAGILKELLSLHSISYD